ncbi:MAG: hypothetical protein FWD39_06610 [Clostridiales bacterium]|nr:hypothetical protein [Clostridiales bacterium]
MRYGRTSQEPKDVFFIGGKVSGTLTWRLNLPPFTLIGAATRRICFLRRCATAHALPQAPCRGTIRR